MSTSSIVANAQKKRVRITLDLKVFKDFNPRDIDYKEIFDLEPAESVSAYVEDFDQDMIYPVR